MKKFCVLIMTLIVAMIMSSCTIDFSDETHDDDYIKIAFYYAVDEASGDLVKTYYAWELAFYEFDDGELESVDAIKELTYGYKGVLSLNTKEHLDVYKLRERQWVSIPETSWYESNQKLKDDVLVEYGTRPVLSPSYEIGDTVRIHYIDNGLFQHYMVTRVSETLYVRYGDLRKLVKL